MGAINSKKLSACLGLALLVGSLTIPLAAADESSWRTYQRLGEEAFRNGHLNRAEQLFKEALTAAEDSHLDSKDISDSLNALAGVLSEQGKPDEAEQHYRRSLNLLEKAYGQHSPELVQTLLDLG